MSRLRLKFDGSLPWDPALIFEAMEELFRKKSEQEHIDIIKENNLTSGSQWIKYHKDNNLVEQRYYVAPWSCFGFNQGEWFVGIFGARKTYKTEQEHIDIIIENSTRGSGQWIKYYKDNSLIEQGYLHTPWRTFGMDCKKWFEKIFGEKHFYAKKEYAQIMVRNDITNAPQWWEYREENNLEEQGYVYAPWQTFDTSCKEWFEKIFGSKKNIGEHQELIFEHGFRMTGWFDYYKKNNLKKIGYRKCPWGKAKGEATKFFEEIYGKIKTREEHIEIILKNNLIDSAKYRYYREENNLGEQGYCSRPWASFKNQHKSESIKDFFDSIFGAKKTYTEKQYKKIMVDNNLTTSEQWVKHREENNLEEQGYGYHPWRNFEIKSEREWFSKIYNKKTYTEKQYIKIMVDNNLTTSRQWVEYRRNNNLKEKGTMYAPWKQSKMTEGDWFAEVRKQINNE